MTDSWLFLALIIFFVIVRGKLRAVEEDVRNLKNELRLLKERPRTEILNKPASAESSWQEAVPTHRYETGEAITLAVEAVHAPDLYEQKKAEEQKIPRQATDAQKQGFEMQFGARLPVWIGGIALALSGFYFVKYSIDAGWLSPAVRIVIGLLSGTGALFVSRKIIRNGKISDNIRIAQAIAGASIADFYFCAFAATNMYDLISPLMGFAGMAAVTALAVILSLQYGAPIALLGMAGGFLTPAIMGSSSPSAPMLFAYLYAISLGLMIVIRRQKWWTLGMLVIAASFVWLTFWICSSVFNVNDAIWLGLFLLVLAATGAKFLWSRHNETEDVPPELFGRLTMGGSVALMCLLGYKTDFDATSLGLLWLLSAGGIVMAYFNNKLYGFVPALSLITASAILFSLSDNRPEYLGLFLIAFAALYVCSGYFLQSRGPDPRFWGSQVVAASLLFYLIGYLKLHETLPFTRQNHFWGILALVLASFSTHAVSRLHREIPENNPYKGYMLSIYAAAATAFVSICLAIELDRAFLPLAMTGEVMALAWIYSRVSIASLRKLAAVLACVYAALIAWQAVTVLEVIAFGAIIGYRMDMPLIDHPLVQLILPAALFLAAASFLRRKEGGLLPHALEVFSVFLFGAGAHFFSREILHPGQDVLAIRDSFTERGIMTDGIFAYAAFCLYAGRELLRKSFIQCGYALAILAVFRLGYLDFFAHNPLFDSSQNVGQLPVLNGLLLSYGVPVLLLGVIYRALPMEIIEADWGKAIRGLMLALSFGLVSLEVRQAFHGSCLAAGIASNAEIYTYSFAWLVFGVTLLFWGTLKDNKMIRIASLGIMILVVCKVFLYDASALTGLLRVVSFLGLGLSLLGLSWFYTKFISKKV